MSRPAPASSRTATRTSSSRNASTSRRPCSAPPRRRAGLRARPSAGSNPVDFAERLADHRPGGNTGPFSMTSRLIGGLDRLVAAILGAGQWLLLPVVALLFLQWPLRDIVRAWSRDANDLGQWLFALYVAMAFTAATRAHPPLAADALARHYSGRTRALLARCGALLGLV